MSGEGLRRLGTWTALGLALGVAGSGVARPVVASVAEGPACGNGIKEGAEECDDGSGNSDFGKDACRTKCTLPRCGDGAVDTNEECDDGESNDDYEPGACRTNCREARCGDGWVDIDRGELCDDGNDNPHDGCHACQPCVVPRDDMSISGHVTFCPGTYELADHGAQGVVRVTGAGAQLDCNGAVLRGPNVSPAAPSVPKPGTLPSVKPKSKSKKKRRRRHKRADATDYLDPSAVVVGAMAPGSFVPRKGTGILVSGEHAVVHDCRVENYATGLRVKSSSAVVFHNLVCENTRDVDATGSSPSSAGNTCARTRGWSEAGGTSCAYSCGSSGYTPQSHQ